MGYRDELCSAIFEVYLKSAKGFKYNEQYNKLKDHIKLHEKIAQDSGKKDLVQVANTSRLDSLMSLWILKQKLKGPLICLVPKN